MLPQLGDFVLYGQQSVAIAKKTTILGGDVGVASVAPAGSGTQLTLDKQVSMDAAHLLVAPSISLGKGSSVGDVETNQLTDLGAKSLGAQSPYPSATPPLALAGTGAVGVAVNVPAKTSLVLAPGSYSTLTAGSHAHLDLQSGTYSFTSVTLADHVVVQAAVAGVTIRIAGATSAGPSTIIGPPASGQASAVRITAFGNDLGSTPVMSFGSRDTIRALVDAPHGTLSFADHVQATGAFAAFAIQVGARSTFEFQDGLAPSAPGLQALPYTNDGIALPVAAPVDPSAQVAVSLDLPIRNARDLAALQKNVSDPSSADYRKYLTTSQFAALFGASPADYQALDGWGTTRGLTTQTFTDRIVLLVVGTAAEIEQAFYVNLIMGVRSDGTQFYEPDRQPSIDSSVSILSIQGIDDFFVSEPAGGSVPGGSYASFDVRNAYLSCSPTLRGEGQTIGIFEAGGFSVNLGDVASYQNLTGLTSSPPVQRVVLCGASGATCSGLKNCSTVEQSLDPEVALAMAPGAQVVIYRGPTVDSAFAAMAQPGASSCGQGPSRFGLPGQISSSWGVRTGTGTLNLWAEFAVQGQSFFQASGDKGKYELTKNVQTQCPLNSASKPTAEAPPTDIRGAPGPLTTVGWTTLSMFGNGVAYQSESGNAGSGGGIITSQPIPPYQIGLASALNGASATNRNNPDVAMVGDNVFAVFSKPFGNTSGTVNGTSVSSPLWAGFMAVVNQANAAFGVGPVGFASPLLYRIAPLPVFNDIVSGANTNTCGDGYNAVSGYDLVTGLGTPRCSMVNIIPRFGTPYPQLFVHVESGMDGLNDASGVVLKLHVTDSTTQTFTLKAGGEKGWGDGTTHDLPPFTLSPPLRPQDVASVEVDLLENGQGGVSADNWDIGGIQVRLGTSSAQVPWGCLTDWSGNDGCTSTQPSCDPGGKLGNTADTGVARLSENDGCSSCNIGCTCGAGQGPTAVFNNDPTDSGCPAFTPGVPAQPFDTVEAVIDTSDDDLRAGDSVVMDVLTPGNPNPLDTLTIHNGGNPKFDNNTEHGKAISLTKTQPVAANIDHFDLKLSNEGNDEWHISGIEIFGRRAADGGDDTCLFRSATARVLNASNEVVSLQRGDGCP